MYRFFITPDCIQGDMASLSGQDARHLAKVLRLRAGDRVELADGNGRVFLAEIQTATPTAAGLVLIRETTPTGEPALHIAVAQALIKEARMDDLIRPLTELGISRWIPFTAERSVPVPDPKRVENRRERWERIAREAIKQCGRARIPEILTPVPFPVLMEMAAGYDRKIAFWERSSEPVTGLLTDKPRTPSRVMVLIGPEGGFSDQEIQMAMDRGFEAYSLGPRILRAETATLAAMTLTQMIFGDLG